MAAPPPIQERKGKSYTQVGSSYYVILCCVNLDEVLNPRELVLFTQYPGAMAGTYGLSYSGG